MVDWQPEFTQVGQTIEYTYVEAGVESHYIVTPVIDSSFDACKYALQDQGCETLLYACQLLVPGPDLLAIMPAFLWKILCAPLLKLQVSQPLPICLLLFYHPTPPVIFLAILSLNFFMCHCYMSPT